MTVRALLFDMGNVIIEISFLKMMAALGVPCQSESDAARLVESWKFHDEYERGLISTDQFRTAVSERLGRDFDAAAFQKGWTSIYVGEVVGIHALLSRLAMKHHLYLLSNTNPAHMDFCLANFAALKTFKHKFLSYELGARKPEREIYERVVSEIGCAAHEILFFDDMPGNVQGARNLGLQAERADRSVAMIVAALERRGIATG